MYSFWGKKKSVFFLNIFVIVMMVDHFICNGIIVAGDTGNMSCYCWIVAARTTISETVFAVKNKEKCGIC